MGPHGEGVGGREGRGWWWDLGTPTMEQREQGAWASDSGWLTHWIRDKLGSSFKRKEECLNSRSPQKSQEGSASKKSCWPGQSWLSEGWADVVWLSCWLGDRCWANGITFYNLSIIGSKGKVRCGDKEEGEVLTLLVSERLLSVYRGKNLRGTCHRCEERGGWDPEQETYM